MVVRFDDELHGEDGIGLLSAVIVGGDGFPLGGTLFIELSCLVAGGIGLRGRRGALRGMWAYGVDGTLTIGHRILLHEDLGQAHRRHAYQLMANELGMSHVVVSLIYMGVQLVISLGFIYLCPNTILAHWIYLIAAGLVLAVAYVLFKVKYYHLHEEYLKSLEK